jgi:hypothetical protein
MPKITTTFTIAEFTSQLSLYTHEETSLPASQRESTFQRPDGLRQQILFILRIRRKYTSEPSWQNTEFPMNVKPDGTYSTTVPYC